MRVDLWRLDCKARASICGERISLMKAALNVVIVIAWFAISICAWAQGAPQNLAALHAGTEKALLSRDLVKAGGLAKTLMSADSEVMDPKDECIVAVMTAVGFTALVDYKMVLAV